MMLWTKKRTIEEILYVNRVLEAKVHEALNKIKELDQHKVYVIQFPGSSDSHIRLVRVELERVQQQMKWTMPKILMFNEELKEVGEKELKEALKKLKG